MDLEQIRQSPSIFQGSQEAHALEQHHPPTGNRHNPNKVGVDVTAQLAPKR